MSKLYWVNPITYEAYRTGESKDITNIQQSILVQAENKQEALFKMAEWYNFKDYVDSRFPLTRPAGGKND